MKKRIISLAILTAIFMPNFRADAREICDCFGNCMPIQERHVDKSVKELVKKRDGFKKSDYAEIDHILPLCLGGSNDASNLQALTENEHAAKTEDDMLILYFVQNCFMTLDEAHEEVKVRKHHRFLH